MTFKGTRLKQLREEKHLTHTDLASELGVGFAQIYRFEAGKASPDADILDLMAEVFGVSVDYLLGRSDDLNAHLTEDNLSADERAVLNAMRRGDDKTVMKILAN